jgi:hypothetical protein
VEFEGVDGVCVVGDRSSGGLCKHGTEFSGNFLTSLRASQKGPLLHIV